VTWLLRVARLGPLLWAVGLLAGCSKDPASVLAAQSLTDAELRPEGDGFAFDAVSGAAVCSGTVVPDQRWWRRGWTVRKTCVQGERLVLALRAGRRCQRGDTAACSTAASIHLSDPHGDRSLAEQWLATACAKQVASACTTLGRLQRSSADPAKVVQARAHLRSACDAKDGEGCWLLVQMLRAAQGGPADPQQAASLCPEACRLGVAGACRDEAERALQAQDFQGGFGWLRKACEAKDEPSCTRLAALLEGEGGAPVDLAAATEALVHACHLGHAAACVKAASRQPDGGRSAEAQPLVRQLLEQGCSGGNPLACVRLGALLAAAPPDTADAARAATLLLAACDQGTGEACRHMATVRPAQAATWLQRACESADAEGCAQWADALRRAPAADRPDQWVGLSQKACTMGAGRGCGLLAQAYRLGAAVPRDPQRALALAQQGCAAGDPGSCADTAAAVERGDGVPRDPGQAAAAWQRACALGWSGPPCAAVPPPVAVTPAALPARP
jgi:TPR repeat protein